MWRLCSPFLLPGLGEKARELTRPSANNDDGVRCAPRPHPCWVEARAPPCPGAAAAHRPGVSHDFGCCCCSALLWLLLCPFFWLSASMVGVKHGILVVSDAICISLHCGFCLPTRSADRRRSNGVGVMLGLSLSPRRISFDRDCFFSFGFQLVTGETSG